MADTTTPSISDQIASAYAANFGRAPDTAGTSYWSNYATQNPGTDLASAIGKNALGADVAAEKSLAGKGANYIGTDNSANTNFNTPTAVWNATTNTWSNPAAPPTPATPTPAVVPPPAVSTYSATPQAPAVQAQTATRTVDPATETVQGQISGIIAANSPLMQQATAKANQAMNDRGLLDSNLAVGAAQGAVLSAATPIATSDANTYSTAAGQNMQAQNTSNLTNAGAQNAVNANNAGFMNTAASFNANATNNAGIVGAQLASQGAIAGSSNATSITNTNTNATTQQAITAANNASSQTIAKLNTDTQVKVQQLQTANQQLLQTNQSAAGMFNQYVTNLANISNSTTMDQAAKDQAAANQLTELQAGLQAIGSITNLDLSKYFQALPATKTTTDTKAAADTTSNGTGGASY